MAVKGRLLDNEKCRQQHKKPCTAALLNAACDPAGPWTFSFLSHVVVACLEGGGGSETL